MFGSFPSNGEGQIWPQRVQAGASDYTPGEDLISVQGFAHSVASCDF